MQWVANYVLSKPNELLTVGNNDAISFILQHNSFVIGQKNTVLTRFECLMMENSELVVVYQGFLQYKASGFE